MTREKLTLSLMRKLDRILLSHSVIDKDTSDGRVPPYRQWYCHPRDMSVVSGLVLLI